MTLIFCVTVFIYFTADSFTKQHSNIFMIFFFFLLQREMKLMLDILVFKFFTLHSFVEINQIAFET